MIESMHKFMRVGLIHFMAFPETMKGEGPIIETIRKIATDDYFDAVEVTYIKDDSVRAQVKKILETAHMSVSFGAQPMLLATGLNVNDLNEERRREAVELLKKGIDQAHELGAEGFAFLSGKYDDNKKEEAYQSLLKSTRELCSYAEKKGNLRVALEIFDYDIDKKSLIGPTPLAKRFAEDMRRECGNFGLMVDLSHIPMLRETIEEAIIPIKDYIVHAHMGNCVIKDPKLPAYGDLHPRFGFPDSENDVEQLTEYLRVLRKIGFINEENPPIVSFEVKPFGDEDPDLVIANAKRVLNIAWSRV
ncbi:xylose isomerase domain-containing protein TIM barrel [Thermoclostridium stercorarium subsp. stercorarium DSM 8532]|jgi:sugar phosphate isomerase/epimerase|uniref:Xylose isomerase domain-containing protein TIM barrel n=3 Tax=Thermoclostridium stercorarium TaxID=1510 RepID=L7VP72_THES1|nr:TIM barrel protein [Thermoclostridium stercorarium]AGC67348.1 xylose isomerase domain-containing protein TIM barrel [Thermoclostridium stercorarium subsp. stercorarium DSM 8532]AGI38409.1 sugar phosphate isomerase [Thermoclostridium stercorarium subsp. stercorarium DSM 8532]ANW97843.1 xylose isomerase [Thermoclostridium stercorarium subsp. thermolacticum DSM 2910]ANX00395.1 xylose isomerase [Thermoclostridium stercorarium subsp. leptospartum DSM 9219]UZQ85940.1 sugar phosphate isomerase/epi